MNALRNFLCDHPHEKLLIGADKDLCAQCGSFWDLKSRGTAIHYGNDYAADRGHLDPLIGRLKVQTMNHWFKSLKLDSQPRVACEVGFGGAWTLAALQSRGWTVHGMEADESLLAHAESLGLPSSRLHLFQQRPARLSPSIDLWLFQDSFEHLEDPDAFVTWMQTSSSACANLLIVAPQADSLSERLLGPWWPHRVKDHPFHWSKRGLVEWLHKKGWSLAQEFNPTKTVTFQTILAHMAHQRHWPWLGLWSKHSRATVPFRFNIGEMGLYFKRAMP